MSTFGRGRSDVVVAQPFRLEVPILVEGLKTFFANLVGPTTTPVVLGSAVTVRVQLEGRQYQAIQ